MLVNSIWLFMNISLVWLTMSPMYEQKPLCGLNPEIMVSPPLLRLVEERGNHL